MAEENPVLQCLADHQGPEDGDRVPDGTLFDLGRHHEALRIFRKFLIEGGEPPCINPVVIG
jgi:hypothetical protein